MARVNISIPDSLYERLDRVRDRVNASRVCAMALEKELDMIEGRTPIADPEIAQLIQRLQTARERWYKRGREDGKRWAVQVASRHDLYRVKDYLEGEDGAELAEHLRRRRDQWRHLFGGYDFEAAINNWVRGDQAGAEFRIGTEDDDEDSIGPTERPMGADLDTLRRDVDRRGAESGAKRPARADVDIAGYMEGWRDVIDEIWQVVSAALQ